MFKNNPTKKIKFTLVLLVKVLVHPKSPPHSKNIDSLKNKKIKKIKNPTPYP
jgi:hypothetical protein